MGNTYETDGIKTGDVLTMTVQAATTMRALSNFVACRSWLQARLALRDLRNQVDELGKTVEKGSMPNTRPHGEAVTDTVKDDVGGKKI